MFGATSGECTLLPHSPFGSNLHNFRSSAKKSEEISHRISAPREALVPTGIYTSLNSQALRLGKEGPPSIHIHTPFARFCTNDSCVFISTLALCDLQDVTAAAVPASCVLLLRMHYASHATQSLFMFADWVNAEPCGSGCCKWRTR